ncbi:hypothetical protein Ddc_08126 [Ditylenchus destructor]|nr:hypothetical protein Ddc_08126 [Ditylenchus destructor]
MNDIILQTAAVDTLPFIFQINSRRAIDALHGSVEENSYRETSFRTDAVLVEPSAALVVSTQLAGVCWAKGQPNVLRSQSID